MYKGIGVNMDKEYKALRKRNKRFVPPSHYRDDFNNAKDDNCNCDDYDNMGNYTFYDAMEDIGDCMESDDNNCKIRSCLLDKKVEVNKRIIVASCIGAIVGIVGVSCAIKKMNSKPKNKLVKYAPTLMKMTKKML
ncbi:hypothetical protein [Clostridium sp. B9]|uniref:hypothetical protein n=1 Tax=Clostridium sp. B9 TaxID=3423224 RepID=UPI003D2EAA14